MKKEAYIMFSVIKCQFVQPDGDFVKGFVLKGDNVYPYWPNKYLHQKSLSSSGTAKQYAYKLAKFLNYLESIRKIEFEYATEEDLEKFITYLRYSDRDGNINPLKSQKSGYTLSGYFTVIKDFYIYLYNHNKTIEIKFKEESDTKARYSYLYGQDWNSKKTRLVIDDSSVRDKPPVHYEKWYTESEKEAILSNLNTVRDKAIFSMSLDGMRIDEVLSSRMSYYNDADGFIEAYRSKRKPTGDTDRLVPLSDRSLKLIDDYLFGERSDVENELMEKGINPPDEMFLNLKKNTKTYGEPVQYNNYLKILKRAAKRAGLNPAEIRTHSGRSTKAGELFRQQASAESSDETLTDNQIAEIMGWKNISSAEPYKNRLDKETAISNQKRLEKAKEKRKETKNNDD